MIGMRWKFRSAIRTALFALVPDPNDPREAFSHIMPTSSVAIGSVDGLSGGDTGGLITSHFLNWLSRVKSFLRVDLPVTTRRQSASSGYVPILVKHDATDWFIIHIEPTFEYPKIFTFSIEWILCHSAIIDNVIDTMIQFAIEDHFNLVRIPHAQIFPPPAADSDIPFDLLPFEERISFQLPSTCLPACLYLILSRTLAQLKYLILYNSREYSHPEGLGGTTPLFSREPGWILMSKEGHIFMSITATKVDWIVNEAREEMEDDFLTLKQLIHTSIVDGGGSRNVYHSV
jgi:hypothetical protein